MQKKEISNNFNKERNGDGNTGTQDEFEVPRLKSPVENEFLTTWYRKVEIENNWKEGEKELGRKL